MLVNRLKRLKAEAGFTTVTLMGVLMVGGLLVMAAFTAVDPDIKQSRDDVDTKQAYAAAESGLQWYMNALGRDNTYYLKCDNPPAPNVNEVAPVNQQWTSGAFKWRNVAGEPAGHVDRPELGTHPAGAHPREIGVGGGAARADVEPAEVVRHLRARLPQQVVVSVDDGVFREQRRDVHVRGHGRRR